MRIIKDGHWVIISLWVISWTGYRNPQASDGSKRHLAERRISSTFRLVWPEVSDDTFDGFSI